MKNKEIKKLSNDEVKNKIHSLKKVLKDSNIISLHLPLTEQTEHIINNEQFNLMKNDTILINVSRGGLINEEALVENLNNGKISLLSRSDVQYDISFIDFSIESCRPQSAWFPKVEEI